MATKQTTNARDQLLAGLPVTERQLQLAGASTTVLEGGDGPPLVLLHGPAGSATHWLRVLPALVRTHRVIAPDLPGHGESEAVDANRVLTWLGELIEQTCESPPTVVGHAVSGSIAARFAATHGNRVSGLVLVDTMGLAEFEPAPEFGAALQTFMSQPDEHTHDDLWRYCALDVEGVRGQMGDLWASFRSYNLERLSPPAVGALIAEFGTSAIPPEELDAIGVPTTLIWGRQDLATPLAVAEAASGRHGWPLHVIENCADDPPIERPDALVRAIGLAAAGFKGEIVGPDHPRYDELRAVFNGMIDRRPALIARCASADDVSAALGFARDNGLPISVYSGGHNVTGNAVVDDGVTIDLRPMKRIAIDPVARVCRAQAGLTWGELDAATQEHGLAVTGGRMSTTGLGGLVLGGGSGWIERKCGYSVDNLLSVEVVTADGQIVKASESENPDLFWGTRGGGGNFGAVTDFQFRLHEIGPQVLAGMLMYPAEMAAAVIANFRDVMVGAPDEIGSGLVLLTAPHEDFVPEPARGKPAVGMVLCYSGPVEDGEEALRPLREFGPPALDAVAPMPYVEVQRLLDPSYPHGLRNYWTGDFIERLPDEAIEILCRFHLSVPSPMTGVALLPGGGAGARVPDGTMAISQRTAPFNIHITSLWSDPADDDANIAWTRQFSAALKPYTTGRVYVNFIGDEGHERVVASFGEEGYARLQQLKRRYDPGNLFRSNQNIEPG